MKIEVNEDREIVLKEVFNGINLESNSGEQFCIVMRDSGFEFAYGNTIYEAKEGRLLPINCIKPCGMNHCDENGCVYRKYKADYVQKASI